MVRDFTFIDDIVLGVIKVLDQPAEPSDTFDSDSPNPGESNSLQDINIGNSSPVPLMKYIESLENVLEKDAKKEFLPMQPGDVKQTSSDTRALQEWIKFSPNTNIKDGIKNLLIGINLITRSSLWSHQYQIQIYVVGLGYVGLPLAIAFGKKFNVMDLMLTLKGFQI